MWWLSQTSGTHICDSGWFKSMYTLQGKPDPHVTCFPRSVHVWPLAIRNSRGPHIPTFRESSVALDGYYCSREQVILTAPFMAQLSGQWDLLPFLSQHSHWSSRLKPSIGWWQATRLTRPILPTYNQYIQYLLTEANSSVRNRHRRGIQHWRCQPATSHSLTFPTDGPSLSTSGPRPVSG
jgi:hypothetical protein